MNPLNAALRPERVVLGNRAVDESGAVRAAVALLEKADGITSFPMLSEEILKRHVLMPAWLGHGLAVPHARTAHASKIALTLVRLEAPVRASNGEPLSYVIAAAIPAAMAAEYLQTIGCIARVFGTPAPRAQIDACKDPAVLQQTLVRLALAL